MILLLKGRKNIDVYKRQDYEYGEDDSKYLMSFKINDVFQEFESHAGEVIMLNVYNPNNDYCEVNKLPYIAIQFDDKIYNAVEEFKMCIRDRSLSI